MSVPARSLFDGELRGRVGFEALVGDGGTAQHRTPVGADGQAQFGALDRLQARAQTGGNGVIGALGSERLGRVAPVGCIVLGGPVVAAVDA